MALNDVSLHDRVDLTKSPVLLNGTQALVRLMLMQKARDRAAGWNTGGYVTGYRASPLGAVDQQMTRAGDALRAADIHFNPGLNEDLLNRAYVYAMHQHRNQTRASGDPYFSHPLEVAAIVTDLKLDQESVVAALLHDTIEDTDATRKEIDGLFGHDIGRLVDEYPR